MNHLYRFGEFELDAEQRLLRCDGRKVALPRKALDILLYMVRNPRRLLEKDELLQAVWPDTFVEEGNLSQNISLLRKALASGVEDFRYIVTVPGRGYEFAAAVELVSDKNAFEADLAKEGDLVFSTVHSTMHMTVREEIEDGVSETAEETGSLQLPAPKSFWRRGRVRWVGTVVAVSIAVAAFFGWRVAHRQVVNQRIVLADFENRTGDTDFDVVLKKALEIDLSQSPYMEVMGARQAATTLQLMGLGTDTPLTVEVAREICERNNRQVLLVGAIANLGQQYLLTLQATDCGSGKILAEAKAEAATKEQVLAGLDSIADDLRHKLGESAGSLQRFQVPIAEATTSSLEALKAYSIGEHLLGDLGKEQTETMPLFLRAVELDPQFAMAHAAVATGYYDLGEYKLAAPYYRRAFELSGQVSEKEKIYIRAHYYADDQKDIEQGIKEYQLWAETYPADWGAWLNIAKDYTELGQYDPAIKAGERALKLDGSRGIEYTVLTRAYLRANRVAEAKSTALRAIQIGKETYNLHALLYEIAALQHDQAGMVREAAWNKGKTGEWYSLTLQAHEVASTGRYRQAEELFQKAYTVAARERLLQNADAILIDEATAEFQLGFSEKARATLGRVVNLDSEDPDLALLDAELGDTSFADRFLAAYGTTSQTSTLMTYVYLPQLRAELALQHGKPLDAIAELERSAPYEKAAGYTIRTQRAEAYLRAGQAEKAVAEYKRLLGDAGVDPTAPHLALARLGLARAEAKAGHSADSKAEYEKLFALWSNADSDLPVLRTARAEAAALK